MDHVRYQVTRVRRRMLLQRFAYNLCWAWFIALCIAMIACAATKIWALSFDPMMWLSTWAGGASGVAILVALLMTWYRAPSVADAAIAIDQQFGLKERLSSSLAMNETEARSDAGQALIHDAARRADGLDVSQHFAHRFSSVALLPLIPIAMMAVLVFIPDATQSGQAQASAQTATQTQIKDAAKELKKQIALRRKRAEAKGLKDAEDLFRKIETDLDKLAQQKNMDQKKAMIVLNDIKKEIEKRRDTMGSKEDLRKQLSQLKKIDQGPADKLVRSLEQGDFGEAKDQIQSLVKKMADGTLSKQEEKQLEKQINQMHDALKKAIEQHEKKKQELERQIAQAEKQGDKKKAEELKKQLEKAESEDQQMNQCKSLCEGLGKAKQAMAKGDPSGAADALSELAEELSQLEQEMAQLEDMDDMMDQLSQTKEQMRCKSCQGAGCKNCQGGMGSGDGKGDGLGEGQGFGDRPEEEGKTSNYESQVRDQPKNGNAISSGFADGPNRKGATRQQVQDAVSNALQDERDPLEDRPLPRAVREHTEQYFNRLRQSSP